MVEHLDNLAGNPYAPPSESSSPPKPSLDERLACPHCGTHRISYLTIYAYGGVIPVRCKSCRVLLKARKHGFGKISSFILALPCGSAAAALLAGNYFYSDFWFGLVSALMFLLLLAGTLVADYFVDRVYFELYVVKKPEEASEL